MSYREQIEFLFSAFELYIVRGDETVDAWHNALVSLGHVYYDKSEGLPSYQAPEPDREKSSKLSTMLVAGLDWDGRAKLFVLDEKGPGIVTHEAWLDILHELGASPGEMVKVRLARMDEGTPLSKEGEG